MSGHPYKADHAGRAIGYRESAIERATAPTGALPQAGGQSGGRKRKLTYLGAYCCILYFLATGVGGGGRGCV